MPPDEFIFNRTAALDLMSIESAAVLHCVDRDTKFGAAAFITRVTTQATWQLLLDIWVNTYIGYSTKIVVDHGTQLTSDKLSNLRSINNVDINMAGVDSHKRTGKKDINITSDKSTRV